ncbi:interleukin enhancer-binding factor 2 homolog, partial [Paramuricea clavata]
EHIQQVADRILSGLGEPTLGLEDVALQVNEGGFNLSSGGVVVRILITTLPKNLREAKADTHVDVKLLEGALATIRHSRWFEENAFHTTVRILVRIMKDMKNRFNTTGLQALTPWLIDLLAHRATVSVSNEPVTINVAFRSELSLREVRSKLQGPISSLEISKNYYTKKQNTGKFSESDSIKGERTVSPKIEKLSIKNFVTVNAPKSNASKTVNPIQTGGENGSQRTKETAPRRVGFVSVQPTNVATPVAMTTVSTTAQPRAVTTLRQCL